MKNACKTPRSFENPCPIPFLATSTIWQSLYAEIDFTHDVQPILNKQCIACHGEVKEAGDISFIFRDQALGTREPRKFVVVPSKPEASEMIARILTDDADDLMPKPEQGLDQKLTGVKLILA